MNDSTVWSSCRKAALVGAAIAFFITLVAYLIFALRPPFTEGGAAWDWWLIYVTGGPKMLVFRPAGLENWFNGLPVALQYCVFFGTNILTGFILGFALSYLRLMMNKIFIR